MGMQLMQEAGFQQVLALFRGCGADWLCSACSEHPLEFTSRLDEDLRASLVQGGANISHYRSYPRVVGETGDKDFVFAHPSADVSRLIPALVRGLLVSGASARQHLEPTFPRAFGVS